MPEPNPNSNLNLSKTMPKSNPNSNLNLSKTGLWWCTWVLKWKKTSASVSDLLKLSLTVTYIFHPLLDIIRS